MECCNKPATPFLPLHPCLWLALFPCHSWVSSFFLCVVGCPFIKRAIGILGVVMDRTIVRNILGCPPEPLRIILEPAKADVALTAQKPAPFPVAVVVILR